MKNLRNWLSGAKKRGGLRNRCGSVLVFLFLCATLGVLNLNKAKGENIDWRKINAGEKKTVSKVWVNGSSVSRDCGVYFSNTDKDIFFPFKSTQEHKAFVNSVTGNGTIERKNCSIASNISAGEAHSCAIWGGIPYCWGDGDWGKLGDGGGYNDALTPVTVKSFAQGGVTKISAGGWHTCAIHNGAAKCWGSQSYGSLGDGISNGTSSMSAVQVKNLTSGVSDISAGRYFSCAVHNGGAKCWGIGRDGRLGNGSTSNKSFPTIVSGLSGGVQKVSAGWYHGCAIHNGAAKCWGAGMYGRLGNGSENDQMTPTTVSGLTSGVTDISVGAYHTCAVHNGAAKCWGYGRSGRLGNGGTSNQLTPVTVSGLTSGVTDISVGAYHTCALQGDPEKYYTKKVKCWGDSLFGALGDGKNNDSSTPVSVIGLTGSVASISVGEQHSCAIFVNFGMTDGQSIKCWGNGGSGRLGNGSEASNGRPMTINDPRN